LYLRDLGLDSNETPHTDKTFCAVLKGKEPSDELNIRGAPGAESRKIYGNFSKFLIFCIRHLSIDYQEIQQNQTTDNAQ
jgi:hypothetical protein